MIIVSKEKESWYEGIELKGESLVCYRQAPETFYVDSLYLREVRLMFYSLDDLLNIALSD